MVTENDKEIALLPVACTYDVNSYVSYPGTGGCRQKDQSHEGVLCFSAKENN
jgi:hypothetical protein